MSIRFSTWSQAMTGIPKLKNESSMQDADALIHWDHQAFICKLPLLGFSLTRTQRLENLPNTAARC